MSYTFGELGTDPLRVLAKPAAVVEGKGKPRRGATALAAPPTPPADQFWLYEFRGGAAGVLDPHKVDPVLEGSDDKPDAIAAVELEAFNFGEAYRQDKDPNVRASLRLDIGKDKGSLSNLDLLMWSASSAIDLAQQIKNKKKPNDLAFKGADVFKRRPIEIPGGLGQINIEVVKHTKPSWWSQLFQSASGAAAQNLIRTLGFPGITADVLDFVNHAFSQFEDNNAEVIFRSRPLTVAMTKRAKRDFTDDNPAYLVAALNRSRYLVARDTDIKTISDAEAVYVGGYGVLAPRADFEKLGPTYDYSSNPLNKLTYGVLRVRNKEATLQQSVDGP